MFEDLCSRITIHTMCCYIWTNQKIKIVFNLSKRKWFSEESWLQRCSRGWKSRKKKRVIKSQDATIASKPQSGVNRGAYGLLHINRAHYSWTGIQAPILPLKSHTPHDTATVVQTPPEAGEGGISFFPASSFPYQPPTFQDSTRSDLAKESWK